MIVPVFTPPPRIDVTNVAEFARTVSEHIARYRCMVIDCSGVEWITAVGMHVIETASSDAPITLVNPNPSVHLMATTFGGDVQFRNDRVRDVPHRRLTSVHTGGKVAS